MKVLFQTRTNLYDAPGGDLIQIQKTKEYLEKLGVQVDISLEFAPDLRQYDIVHLFNLMDPEDIYLQLINARKQHKKIALSTIYGMYSDFERNARGGLFQKLANIISPNQINYIKIIARHYKEKRMHRGVYQMMVKGNYGLTKEIVDSIDMFLPNSDSEMKRVASEYKLTDYKYFSIPNAVDKGIFLAADNDEDNEFGQYKGCILCVARIEGRKSTLNLVKAVSGTNYQLVLVGKASANQKGYVEQVRREAGDNVHFAGTMSQQQLRKLYQLAKVHVLPSWMETPGLSSLEAAAMGCNVVVTKKGDAEDYFGEYAFYCEPDNVASIREAIDRAYSSQVDPKLRQKIMDNYTWEKTAQQTLKAYEAMLS